MSDVVRLAGDDREVVAAADAALRSVGDSHAEWVAGVRRLHVMRREFMQQITASPVAERHTAETATTSTPLTRLWWIALSVGSAAAVVGSAPMLPPRHPQDPGLIMTIAPPAIAVAALLLLLTAATVPRSARSSTAVGLAAMSGVLALAALLVNLFRGDALAAAGGTTGVVAWMLGAAGAVIGSVVLVLRTRGGKQSRDGAGAGAGADSRRAWRSAATELRGDAKRLLRRTPSDAAVQERWASELAGLEAALPAEALAQARKLGPWGWLVWSAYDGDISLPQLLKR